MINEKEVFIAVPMYGGACFAPFVTGMLQAQEALSRKGYKLGYQFLCNESLITRGRNSLVNAFLTKTTAKYFLFIDADIGFKGEDVVKLIETNKEFICGLYPKKLVDWPRVNIAAKMGLNKLENYAASYVVNPVELNPTHDAPLESSIVEIKHAGTGFMLIQRSVFEKLSPYVKEYRNSTIKNEDGVLPPLMKEYFALDIVGDNKFLLSEDWFFCNLWREHGGSVYADLSIKLSHFGSYEYKGDLFVGGANQGT